MIQCNKETILYMKKEQKKENCKIKTKMNIPIGMTWIHKTINLSESITSLKNYHLIAIIHGSVI